ncbi:putative membrane protein [Streptomyces davaonensis JCM 4913]|uniref:Putative membrane protein n=1 Tax=Streptomyces davaonensis (strain DSM 101723 / JCM 4913 / KCC S-0913 / 768) TaxID=1214101 RepID=K4QUR5_STRDJ|nr:putative membrane protein [Streptomyces davaonensis JCM 4913]
MRLMHCSTVLLFMAAAEGLLPDSANGLFGLLLWVCLMFVCWAPF